jgi:hypothetical protein
MALQTENSRLHDGLKAEYTFKNNQFETSTALNNVNTSFGENASINEKEKHNQFHVEFNTSNRVCKDLNGRKGKRVGSFIG